MERETGDEDDRHLDPGDTCHQSNGGGQGVRGGNAGNPQDGAAEESDRPTGQPLVDDITGAGRGTIAGDPVTGEAFAFEFAEVCGKRGTRILCAQWAGRLRRSELRETTRLTVNLTGDHRSAGRSCCGQ